MPVGEVGLVVLATVEDAVDLDGVLVHRERDDDATAEADGPQPGSQIVSGLTEIVQRRGRRSCRRSRW